MGDPLPRILKKGSAPRRDASADELLAAAQRRSHEIVAAAEDAAKALRAAATADAAQARAAAVADGHAEGLGKAAAALARVAEAREARLTEIDGAVVEVALDVARRILERELATSPSAVVDVAKRALRAAVGSGDVVLRVSPEDEPAVREADDALRRLVERGSLSVVEDPRIGRGEVVVETVGGRVDARIDAQLESFRRALHAEAG